MLRYSFVLFFTLLFRGGLSAQSPQQVDSYIFGNSLVHHIVKVIPTPSDEDSAPHWMHFLAEAAGKTFRIAGDFGALPFLISQNQIELDNNWSFDSVASAWDAFNVPFAQSDLDNVVITPLNYVQYRTPTQTYEFGDTFHTPISAADTLIEWVTDRKPGTHIYLYEGWPDMAPFSNASFPPTANQWAAYQDAADFDSPWHDWFIELHDSLMARNPNVCVKMIPVGPIIAELLNRAPYNTMAIDSIYEDDAPHGRPTIYLMAGMICYMAMYEERAPLNYQPPAAFIDPVVIARYDSLVEEIWTELQAFRLPDNSSRVFCNEPLTGIEAASFAVPHFRAYPNPVSSRLRIETDVTEGQLMLRDLMGRVLKAEGIVAEMDLAGLSEGFYLLELRSDRGEVLANQKLVVRH